MGYPPLLPANSTDLEVALAELDASRIGGLDAQIIWRIHSIDETPEEFLPFLAWERSVDQWDPAWPIEVKREVVRSAYEVHRYKGTAWGVERAIEATGFGAKVEEWFEYDGDPYKFRLTINLSATQSWTGSEQNILVRTALKSKNGRSFLEYISLRRTSAASLYVGGFISAVRRTFIGAEAERLVSTDGYLFIGGYLTSRQHIQLVSEA